MFFRSVRTGYFFDLFFRIALARWWHLCSFIFLPYGDSALCRIREDFLRNSPTRGTCRRVLINGSRLITRVTRLPIKIRLYRIGTIFCSSQVFWSRDFLPNGPIAFQSASCFFTRLTCCFFAPYPRAFSRGQLILIGAPPIGNVCRKSIWLPNCGDSVKYNAASINVSRLCILSRGRLFSLPNSTCIG